MKTVQRNNFGKLFLAISLVLSACKEDCGDPGYSAQFYITDKKTGKPYFDVSTDKIDSVRVYINGLPPKTPPVPIYKNYDSKRGYTFADIDIRTDTTLTVYLYFNRQDTDTLKFNNIITSTPGRCAGFKYITTAIYNGHVLPLVSSDTTGIATFNLIK